MKKDVYITRDTHASYVEVWPAAVGIRKFHGCVQYGAAWNNLCCIRWLYPSRLGRPEVLFPHECRKRFGFYPRKGAAWFVPVKGKREKVELAFSP